MGHGPHLSPPALPARIPADRCALPRVVCTPEDREGRRPLREREGSEGEKDLVVSNPSQPSRSSRDTGFDEEVAWRCQNIAGCPAQLTRRVEYFAARKGLDLESLGGIVAEKLVERGLVKEPLDLFNLKLEVLGKLNLGTDDEPRTFGEKNATKILDALQRAKTALLSRWICAGDCRRGRSHRQATRRHA